MRSKQPMKQNQTSGEGKFVSSTKSKEDPEIENVDPLAPFQAKVANGHGHYSCMWNSCVYSSNLVNYAKVKVTHIWHPTNLFIQAVEDQNFLKELQALVQNHARRAKPLSSVPKVGEMILAKYSDEWYRGRVIGVSGENCQVVLVDSGPRMIPCFSDLLPVNERIMQFPIYGLSVHLNKLPTDPKSVKLTPELKNIVEKNVFQLKLVSEEELIPSEFPVSVDLLDRDFGYMLTLNEQIKWALWPVTDMAPPPPKKAKLNVDVKQPLQEASKDAPSIIELE